METIEATFNHGEYDSDIGQPKWHARITWRCPICGRRNSKLFNGSGQMPLRMEVVCKLNHRSLVVPHQH